MSGGVAVLVAARTLAIGLAVVGLGLGLPACASAPGGASSTRLTVDDIEEITTQMSAKLRASEFLAARGADSAPMTIAIQRVTNLSSDVIPVSEQWYLMDRVRNSLPIIELGRDRNLAFVIPAERLEELRALGFDAGAAANRAPTHVMDAVFRSATRSGQAHRTDFYLCEYRITDLETGALAWADSFEIKRAAFGRSWD
ncbi:MAG: hypothetical protein KDA31_10185 [Phycisphaerales bacterium]|nr:hypothetical protein [Phycisphaerales bacterium]